MPRSASREKCFAGLNSGEYRSSGTTASEKMFPRPRKPWFDCAKGTLVPQFAARRAGLEVHASLPATSRYYG